MSRLKLLFVFGTRPEAIKMAPVIRQLRLSGSFVVEVCVTGQHREMLDQVLKVFAIEPDFDLAVMTPGQSLSDLTVNLLKGLDDVLCTSAPDWVVVHGDTTSTFAASVASFYRRIPIAHVEAGLRTWDLSAPWPEEANRQLTGRLANLHFAPTEQARGNLQREGVPEDAIHVTGNTVIDALLHVSDQIDSDSTLRSELSNRFDFLDPDKKVVLVTGHRRENFGIAFERVCRSLREIAADPGVQIVYPVHLNPSVQRPVRSILGDVSNIFLLDPIDYLPFVYLMKLSDVILTDSGGVQEEAPALGKHVLVMRETTERPEGVAAGLVTLVGSDMQRILSEVRARLSVPSSLEARTGLRVNPFGDGLASQRICEVFESLGKK
jgi:UDP-N-acetylglucosamine 2-epimerase (non-hydrolysing)